jgi:cell division protein FtsQ
LRALTQTLGLTARDDAGARSGVGPKRRGPAEKFARAALARFDTGAALAGAVLLIAGAAGFWIGGGHDVMAREHGRFRDMAARLAGFGVRTITMTGQKELEEGELLRASGLTDHDSLPFLNPAETRERLMKLPLVGDAEVAKLYPDRLVISVKEREPFAVWQNAGELAIVSRDGTVIDRKLNPAFVELPFVVGDRANLKVEEYAQLLATAKELRVPVRAGVLVSGRRWTLRLENGIDVKLPETGAQEALATVARLDRDSRLLQKDIVSVDMRISGRVTARLTPEALAAWQARRPAKKGDES